MSGKTHGPGEFCEDCADVDYHRGGTCVNQAPATPALARFRADPTKVRVAVRRIEGGWQATISKRLQPSSIVRAAAVARTAVMMALDAADYANWEGIDLSMGWAYEHPFRRKP